MRPLPPKTSLPHMVPPMCLLRRYSQPQRALSLRSKLGWSGIHCSGQRRSSPGSCLVHTGCTQRDTQGGGCLGTLCPLSWSQPQTEEPLLDGRRWETSRFFMAARLCLSSFQKNPQSGRRSTALPLCLRYTPGVPSVCSPEMSAQG